MTFLDDVLSQLDALRAEGLYKHEEPLTTAQAAHVGVRPERHVLTIMIVRNMDLHPEC